MKDANFDYFAAAQQLEEMDREKRVLPPPPVLSWICPDCRVRTVSLAEGCPPGSRCDYCEAAGRT